MKNGIKWFSLTRHRELGYVFFPYIGFNWVPDSSGLVKEFWKWTVIPSYQNLNFFLFLHFGVLVKNFAWIKNDLCCACPECCCCQALAGSRPYSWAIWDFSFNGSMVHLWLQRCAVSGLLKQVLSCGARFFLGSNPPFCLALM